MDYDMHWSYFGGGGNIRWCCVLCTDPSTPTTILVLEFEYPSSNLDVSEVVLASKKPTPILVATETDVKDREKYKNYDNNGDGFSGYIGKGGKLNAGRGG